MITAVACAGAPRDLGLDQGRACREALAARFAAAGVWARWRGWLGLRGHDARRLDRSLWRHFPHQAESLRGLAVGAGVPVAWLVTEFARDSADASPAAALEPGLLGRGLDGQWIVRRSAPEGLFASVEIARPGLPAGLLGVNERGLAVAALPGRGERDSAPAWLLGQDCLERFAALPQALEWCLARPGRAGGRLLLAEPGGEVAGVELAAERRLLRSSDDSILHAPDGEVARLGKALHQRGEGAAGLAALLDGAAVDARERCLCVAGERFSP